LKTQNYHHGDLKTALIREGLRILDEEGYEGLSLRKVAKACNVSQTAPYRHFKNKDDLVFEISVQALRAFDDSLKQALIKYPDDPKSQLREMGVMYIKFFTENPEYLRLLFINTITSKMVCENEESCSEINKRVPDCNPFATFYNAVERYKASSGEEELDRDALLLYCWGIVHGISVLVCTNQMPFQKDILDTASRILWSNKF
jgi:AcrR family transcriptional regulator